MTCPEFTTEELQNEIWKSVLGFEDFYEVSDLGRVKGLRPYKQYKAGRILKPNLCRPYPQIILNRRGFQKGFLVHQLVALAFIGPRPKGKTVNHEDGVKTNNRASNLNYKTPQEQMDHAKDHGLVATGDRNAMRKYPERHSRGESHHHAKLTRKAVRAIRKAYKPGKVSYHTLAKRYGVSDTTIMNVIHWKIWIQG